jgi:hypothetical protein
MYDREIMFTNICDTCYYKCNESKSTNESHNKIYDLLVNDGGSFVKRMAMTIVCCKLNHIFYCGDGERGKKLQKKLTKPNLNKMSYL